MAKPTDEQVKWLASKMAARMLVDAASSAREQQLYDALGFWLLDSVAPNQRREIAKAVQVEWLRLGALVEQRLGTLLERDAAKPLDGCEGRI